MTAEQRRLEMYVDSLDGENTNQLDSESVSDVDQ